MDELLQEIIERVKSPEGLSGRALETIIMRHNRAFHESTRHFAKKQLYPALLRTQQERPQVWCTWNIDDATMRKLTALLQMKPRRSASGVATITVITKPHVCSSACLFCPNDVRMPKSYLYKEPACQRAERNFFDPYLQVAGRIHALHEMGHATDKIELIVLGGTWSDYPEDYQLWFTRELFRALNDTPKERKRTSETRRAYYEQAGIACDNDTLTDQVEAHQQRIDQGELTYNQAVRDLYGPRSAWHNISHFQRATLEEVAEAHRINETAASRVVGFVVETRPDAITAPRLTLLRCLGCTKVQIGIQSTRDEILRANNRHTTQEEIHRAFALIRLFGFKIHAHYMVNLLGATPETDMQDYETFSCDLNYSPDEIKLYPCALVGATGLVDAWGQGMWHPYSEQTLIDVLTHCVLATPPYIRVSRMIRDINSQDILTGNKKPNLRQMVEARISEEGKAGRVEEIRFREINRDTVQPDTLTIRDTTYPTQVSTEHFLEWITPEGKIAGFLRLSLPHADVTTLYDGLGISSGEAMIREVHIYGEAARIHAETEGAQHRGLGRALIEYACALAAEKGYHALNVISSVGTRAYYRRLGFVDGPLYQTRSLDAKPH